MSTNDDYFDQLYLSEILTFTPFLTEFHENPDVFMYRRHMCFDSGILKDNHEIREDVYVCLDVFRAKPVSIDRAISALEHGYYFFLRRIADGCGTIEFLPKISGNVLGDHRFFAEIGEIYGESV